MLRPTSNEEWQKYWLSIEGTDDDEGHLPKHSPYGGIVEEDGVFLSSEAASVLQSWENSRDHTEVLYFDMAKVANETPRSLWVTLDELQEDSELGAIVHWTMPYVILALDHSWAIYRNWDHELHFSGPKELAERLGARREPLRPGPD